MLTVILGRTGRIGHRGLATSFYDSRRDEPLASVLTRTLLETNQDIPDFLEEFKPQGDALENLKFEADSDFEENGDDEADAAGGDAEGGGSWGVSASSDTGEASASGDNAWGAAGGQDNASGGGGWGATAGNETATATANADAGNGWGGGASSGW